MDVTGTWFMNPGDTPADFVYPVVLHADGVAEWLGGERGKQPWRIAGDQLMIGDGVQELLMFDLRRAGNGWLSGVTRCFLADDEEIELEEGEEPMPDHFTEAAILIRDAGELRVIEDSADRRAELEAERAAELAKANEMRGEWGQLGNALL